MCVYVVCFCVCVYLCICVSVPVVAMLSGERKNVSWVHVYLLFVLLC